MDILISALLTTGVFLLLFIIYKAVTKNKTRIEKYKLKTNVVLGICFFILMISIISIFTTTDNFEYKSDSSFSISSYDVKIDVSSDNVASIEETIVVNFTQEGNYGIFRTLPYWLKYTGKDGKTISRRFELDEIDVPNDNFTITTENGKEKIKIGDENKTLPIGEKTYTIKYKYNMGNDPYESNDEFIYHVFGDYWKTTINNATIEVTMPKEIDGDIKFFTDKYRKNDITDNIQYSVDGKKLYVRVPNDITLNSSLTIDIVLPDGYFKDTVSTYNNGSVFCIIVIVIIFIKVLIKWFRFGKDFKNEAKSGNFHVENYDAASIGYIYKQSTGNKLLIATIIELANYKALNIEEKDNTIILTNLKSNNLKLSSNQKIVYDYLFKDGDEIDLATLKVYDVIKDLNKNLRDELEEKIEDNNSYKNMFKASIYLSVSIFMWFLGYSGFNDLEVSLYYLYAVSFVLIILTFIFTLLMKRRNSYGEVIYDEVDSYRDYLKRTTDDEIKSMNSNNLNDCSKVIAYAYALGVSKKYLEKINRVIPNISDYPYLDSGVLDSMSSTTSSSSGGGCSSCGGGGCSSCGGGGGGCSSCGGGGSW